MIDLFEHLELLPIEVLSILEKYSELSETYENCGNMVSELEQVGYTCDYYLDAVVFDLRNIQFDLTFQEFKDFFHTAEGMFKDNKLNLKNNWKEFSEIFDKKNIARKECLLLPLRTVLKALQ